MDNDLAVTMRSVYEELSSPSVDVLYRALRKRGIQVAKKDAQEFVSSRAERQIIAPPPKFKGHVVANDVDARWGADLISFVSRPATFKGVEFK